MRVNVGDIELHVAEYGTDAGYVLMGTVDSVEEPGRIDERLAAFEPAHLRERVTRSWADAETVQIAEQAEQLFRDQLRFHVAEPEGVLVRTMQENVGGIVFRREVLRQPRNAQSWQSATREKSSATIAASAGQR